MKRFMQNNIHVFAIILCVLLFSSAGVHAETMYVSEVKITFRREPGNSRKILDMLPPGQSVEVLEQSEDWTKVQLTDGKEGWVLSRYLTTRKPNVFALEALKKEHSMLSNQVTSLGEENNGLKQENQKLLAEFTANKKRLEETSRAYKNIKADCANPSNLRKNYEKTVSHLKEQRKKAEKLEKELEEIQADQGLRWFLTERGFEGFLWGAGVLFIGFVTGFIARRQSRRSFR